MRIAVVLLCTVSWVSSLAQTTSQKQPESLIERACAGESAAATEVEERGDSQDLQRMMHDPDCSVKVGARFALAKRGDHEALQFFACKSLTDRIDVMGIVLREVLPHLGGEFTVEVYRQLLDSDQRFQADFTKHQDDCSDCILTPLSVGVPSMLHQLLPDAPIPSPTPLQLQANSHQVAAINSLLQ